MRVFNCFCLFAIALIGCQPVIETEKPPKAKPSEIHEEWPRDLANAYHPSYPDIKEITSEEIPSPTPLVIAESEKPVISLPPPPPLTQAGRKLLLSGGGRALVFEFETGGLSGYDPHPERPPGMSGITWGIGYDAGYYSATVIKSDWSSLDSSVRDRLAAVSGLKGQSAQNKLSSVRDIYVQWAIATDVFDRVDVAREYSSAKRAMPGFEDIRQNAQAAIISLGFNRGWSMSGDNRREMRAIRDLVPIRDYEGMAIQFRKMVRVWIGTKIEKGMTRRRIAEAKLLMTP